MATSVTLAAVPAVDVAPEAIREWLTIKVYETCDRVVLALGEYLEVGRDRLGKEGYEEWVVEDLPFGLDTAKRYRAVYRAYANLPKSTLDQLPRAWQALYALKEIDHPSMLKMLSSGEVGTKTTVVEAKRVAKEFRGDRWTGDTPARDQRDYVTSRADAAAAELLTFDAAELSPVWRQAIESWLVS